MTLESGRLRLVSRLQDYANRGNSLESYSLLRFVRDTYNGTKLSLRSIALDAGLANVVFIWTVPMKRLNVGLSDVQGTRQLSNS